MNTEIYCYYNGELDAPDPYNHGFRRNFDDITGPGCYDPGLSDFPKCFQKYSTWCIDQGIYMTLSDDIPFINDDGDRMYISLLQFDSVESAMAFKLRWL